MDLLLIFKVWLLCMIALGSYLLLFHSSTVFLTLGVLVTISIIIFTMRVLLPMAFPNNEMVSTKNKAVLITGCDTGFGNRLARRLDTTGVVTIATCLQPGGDGALELIHATSSRLHVVGLDVTKNDQVTSAMNRVKHILADTNTELWCIVNNAGMLALGPIEWYTMYDFLKMFNVNLFGMVNVTKTFMPLIRASAGRIVNVASLAGRLTVPQSVPYAMTKHAVVSFCDGLRQELAPFGIKVSVIEPVGYSTSMLQANSIFPALDRLWHNASDEAKEAYGEACLQEWKDTFLRESGTKLRSNIDEVVDCMFHAVMASTPKSRYVPPEPLGHVITTILSLLPLERIDSICKSFNMKRLPAKDILNRNGYNE